jgi:hypothetical protein
MIAEINILKEKWETEELKSQVLISNDEISSFEKKNNLVLPNDLVHYFKIINGSNNKYDSNLFKFYDFKNFKSINEGLKDWKGIPDYSNIVNTLEKFENYYVFADYFYNTFTYAIRLYNQSNLKNEVLVICGDEYNVISNSFSKFIELFISNSIELQFNQ